MTEFWLTASKYAAFCHHEIFVGFIDGAQRRFLKGLWPNRDPIFFKFNYRNKSISLLNFETFGVLLVVSATWAKSVFFFKRGLWLIPIEIVVFMLIPQRSELRQLQSLLILKSVSWWNCLLRRSLRAADNLPRTFEQVLRCTQPVSCHVIRIHFASWHKRKSIIFLNH